MPSGYATATGGAELTREQVAQLLVEPLLAQAVVFAAGPRQFASQGGVPVRVPKIASFALNDPWRAENTAIAESDPTYGELTLLPSSLKSLKTLHRFSNELARHSVTNIATVLQDALVRRVANALDSAFLTGDGAANTVTGLANQTGVQTMAAVGTPVVDDLHDAEGKLLGANADPASSVWFMNPRDLVTLRKQRDGGTTGGYLVQPDPTEAGAYRLLGHRVFVSTQIPATGGVGTNESTILFVDMSQVAVARDQDISVTLLDQTYAANDQLALRVTARFDIGLLNAPAVVVLQGVTP